MKSIKVELGGHASKSKEYKTIKSKFEKKEEQLKSSCRLKSTGSEQNPHWEEEQTTGCLLQTCRGPTTQTNDYHNPIGRGHGRGYNGGRSYYPNYDPNQDGLYRCIY